MSVKIAKSPVIVSGAKEYEVKVDGVFQGVIFKDQDDPDYATDFMNGYWPTLRDAKAAVVQALTST